MRVSMLKQLNRSAIPRSLSQGGALLRMDARRSALVVAGKGSRFLVTRASTGANGASSVNVRMMKWRTKWSQRFERRTCSNKAKEGESSSSSSSSAEGGAAGEGGSAAGAGEEAASRSIPHLILGMGAGVGGCWLGLGGLCGATYMASSMGDNALAGRLAGILTIATFALPPAIGAFCYALVIQMEWGFGFFLAPAMMFYGLPVYTFMNSTKESKAINEETRSKRLKMLMNLNQTDLQNLHATTAKLCAKAKNGIADADDSSNSWAGFGTTGLSGGSYGSTSSFGSDTFGGDTGILVSKSNLDTLLGVLREAFNAGANQTGILKKKNFYRAMSGAVSEEEKEILMFYNRVTSWGMNREVDFREFAFTMMFFIGRSEENYSSYQEAIFQFLDTKSMGSLGVDEITELVDLTGRFFGKPKQNSTFGIFGFGQNSDEATAKEAMSQIGKSETSRCEPHEFNEIMTNMGFSY